MAERVFRIGIVGGAGPAVIADFMRKIVRHATARRDGTHLGMLVEQSPRIADRTENLIGAGPDLTIALHAACNNLAAAGADLIAIPCNTPRAFVQRVQPHFRVQIANMLDVTARHVADAFPSQRRVGLLATSGTLASGVYERTLEGHGKAPVLPAAAAQSRLMDAIYGASGVKAGFVSGSCQDNLYAALDDLHSQGVDLVILGCPELALLLSPTLTAGGERVVPLIDPATVLAQHCVACAVAERACAPRDAASHQAGAALRERAQGQQAMRRLEPSSTIHPVATAESVPRASTSNRRALS